jgi:hypothetical protein
MLHRTIGLQREQPLATAFLDQASRFALAMQGVTRDQNAIEIDQTEQRARRRDLAFLFAGGDLADRHPRAGGEGRDHV